MKTTSKILQIINILFLILTFLFLVIQWNQIPIQIPTHYDIYGTMGQCQKFMEKVKYIYK